MKLVDIKLVQDMLELRDLMLIRTSTKRILNTMSFFPVGTNVTT